MKRIDNPQLAYDDKSDHLKLKLGELEYSILKGGEFHTFVGGELINAEVDENKAFNIVYWVDGAFYERKSDKDIQYKFSMYRVLFSPYFKEKFLKKCNGQNNTGLKI